ncbi:MAG: hypothetical protein AAGG75_05115 [Bacteroidota bacterium]
MKVSKLFLLVGILATFVFASCNKDDQAVQLPELTDAEWLTAVYNSEAAIGTGKLVDGEKFGFTVEKDKLPQSLRTQLDDKKVLAIDAKVSIDEATTQSIWGDQIPEAHTIKNGFVINAQDVEIQNNYMSPDGEDLSEMVTQNPSILYDRNAEIIEYIFVIVEEILVDVEIEENGEITETYGILVYVETCTIIIL